jgi:hypothetical protein
MATCSKILMLSGFIVISGWVMTTGSGMALKKLWWIQKEVCWSQSHHRAFVITIGIGIDFAPLRVVTKSDIEDLGLGYEGDDAEDDEELEDGK